MHLSIGDAFKQGWEIFKSRPWFFIGAGVILLIATIVVGLITEAINYAILGEVSTDPEQQGTVVGNLVNFLLASLINMGAIAFYLKAYDNLAATSYGDLWHPQSYLKYLAVSVLFGLAVGIGTLLLIVPGIIALLFFFFSPFIVIDRDMGPIDAMKASVEITKGNRWQLLGLVVVALLLNIVGILAFVVGLLVTIPITTLAIVHAYRLLGGAAARAPADAAYA